MNEIYNSLFLNGIYNQSMLLIMQGIQHLRDTVEHIMDHCTKHNTTKQRGVYNNLDCFVTFEHYQEFKFLQKLKASYFHGIQGCQSTLLST